MMPWRYACALTLASTLLWPSAARSQDASASPERERSLEVPQPSLEPAPEGERQVIAALIVGGPKLSPALAAELEHQLKQAVLGRAGIGLLDLRRGLAPEEGEDVKAVVHAAEVALKAGLTAYENLDAPEAIRQLRQACEHFEVGYAEVYDSRQMVEAHTYLGSVLRQTGETAQADEHFRLALFLDPGLELDPNLFPPDDIKALEVTRRDIAQAPKGKAEIESEPVSSRAYVDGIYRGTTPVVVSNLAPGDHFLLTERDGYQPVATRIDIKPQRTRRFEQNLIAARRLAELQRTLDRVDPARVDLGGAAEELKAMLPGSGAVLVSAEMRVDGAGIDTRVHYVDYALGRRARHVDGRLPVGGPKLGPKLRALVDQVLDPTAELEPAASLIASGDGGELELDLPWDSIFIGAGVTLAVAAAAAGAVWLVTSYEEPAPPLEGGRRLSVLGF